MKRYWDASALVDALVPGSVRYNLFANPRRLHDLALRLLSVRTFARREEVPLCNNVM
jgi:hypothetical protein